MLSTFQRTPWPQSFAFGLILFQRLLLIVGLLARNLILTDQLFSGSGVQAVQNEWAYQY